MTRRDPRGRFRPRADPPLSPGRRKKAIAEVVAALEDGGIPIAKAWIEVIDPDAASERHSYRLRFADPVVGSAPLVLPLKAAVRALARHGYQWRTAVMLDVGMVRHGEAGGSLSRAALGVTILVWLDELRRAGPGEIRPRGGELLTEVFR